jgi:hypothetical protein
MLMNFLNYCRIPPEFDDYYIRNSSFCEYKHVLYILHLYKKGTYRLVARYLKKQIFKTNVLMVYVCKSSKCAVKKISFVIKNQLKTLLYVKLSTVQTKVV